MLLRFNTDQGRNTLNLLRQALQKMQEDITATRSATNALIPAGWQAPAAQEFSNNFEAWFTRISQLLENMTLLNTRLEAEIAEWEEAGQTFGNGSSAGVTPPVPVPVPTPGPTPTPSPTPSPGAPAQPAPAPETPQPTYDGKHPAEGTSARPWVPIDAPVQNTPNDRGAEAYANVINQFGVATNSRYAANQQGKGETYCNIFVWDVTRAMGAEIPHWVDKNGKSTAMGKGSELDANGSIKWLGQHGKANGWRAVSATEAQALANQGKPVVATWSNPGGIGHVGMVRPGEYSSSKGPVVAQAGGTNSNSIRVADSFGAGWRNNQIVYYVHP